MLGYIWMHFAGALVLILVIFYISFRRLGKAVKNYEEVFHKNAMGCLEALEATHMRNMRKLAQMDHKIWKQKQLELLRLKKKVRRASRKNKRKK